MGDELERDTKMEVRLDGFPQVRYGKIPVPPVVERTRLNGCFVMVCSSIVLWTVVFQLLAIECYGILISSIISPINCLLLLPFFRLLPLLLQVRSLFA
jgi:hypothetical protein